MKKIKAELYLIIFLLLNIQLFADESFNQFVERSKKDIDRFFHPCKNLSTAKCFAQGNVPFLGGVIPRIIGSQFIDNSDFDIPLTINKLKWDVEKKIDKTNLLIIKLSCKELKKDMECPQ
jgi:hypothetical protein